MRACGVIAWSPSLPLRRVDLRCALYNDALRAEPEICFLGLDGVVVALCYQQVMGLPLVLGQVCGQCVGVFLRPMLLMRKQGESSLQ